MKFKRVEISAFRIYDKPADATFDFVIDSGDLANLVALYAPNGFGKTSFYDAVEWGITNNVQRFWQNESITDKSINAQREISESQVQLLRNNRSPANRKSWVKITTDQTTDPIDRKLAVHGNSRSDIANKDAVENKGFRKVILSQEWISAFLKEVKGDRRYQIFMENPDLVELDTYYKGVKSLVSVNNDYINLYNSQIDAERQKIIELNEGNLLETINSLIIKLNEKGEDLKIVSLSFTDKDTLDFNNKISSKTVFVNRQLEQIKALISLITVARNGNEKVTGLQLYFESLNSKLQSETEAESINSLIKKFELQNELKNENANVVSSRTTEIKQKELIEKLLSQFSDYASIAKLISDKSESKKPLVEKIQEINNKNTIEKNKEAELKTKLYTASSQLEIIGNKLTNLPEFKVNFEKLKTDILTLEKDMNKWRSELGLKETNKKVIEDKIKEYEKIAKEIEKNNYPVLMEEVELSNLKSLINELTYKEDVIRNSQLKLDKITLKINQQESFNTVVEEFIKKGLEIVNESQASSCPLCTQVYQSHNELAEKISSNKLLRSILQDLLKERNEILDSISKVKSEIQAGKNSLISSYSGLISTLNEKLTILKREIETIKKSIADGQRIEEGFKIRLTDFNRELNGLSIEDYEKHLINTQNEIKKSREILSKSFSDTSHSLIVFSDEIKTLNAQLGLIEQEINTLLLNEKYLLILNWFKEKSPNSVINQETITKLIAEHATKIHAYSSRLAEIETILSKLNTELSSYLKDDLINHKNVNENRRQQCIKSITAYQDFLRNELKLPEVNLQKEELEKLLVNMEADKRIEEGKYSQLKDEYLQLEKYNSNLLPYLQSEKAKIELTKKEAELFFLQNTLKPLFESEKKKVREYLEKKVKDFFYTDLINQIYNKIDPHPDYKSVEFVANFDSDNPSLDVLVTDSNNEHKLIPNLYFSTAQINILSVSIFLASALNSKEYDCIFIDDPIQSMDSINILSTIDLFRSIIVNQKKQIILATHDENFYKLMMKKIPSDMFKSKFLELETFGKVKQERV